MTPLPRNILLFGATGVIGKYLVRALIESKDDFDNIGVFTSPATVQNKNEEIEKLREQGVKVIVGNLESEDDVKKAYEDYDTIISALGRSAILLQIPLLQLAETSPTVHTFYPSEFGTDVEYNTTSSPLEKPHQLKLQVRAYIREKIDKLNITYLVTGPYSDLYLAPQSGPSAFAGAFYASEGRAILLGDGNCKVSFTSMRDVGRLLVAALKTPAPTSPRVLKVNSFTASPHEILAEFEKQTGSRWEVLYTSLDELRDLEKKAWENGDGTRYTLRRIWTEGGTLYDERDNGKIGEPEVESLEEQVRQAVGRAKL